MTEYTFRVPGTPIAKKRPRFVRKGNYVGTYNAQETEEGRFVLSIMDQIRTKGYAEALPLPPGTPIRLECWFWMPVPKSWSKKATRAFTEGMAMVPHVKTPDCDNLLKFVKDCLNGQAWRDDCQVVYEAAGKFYGKYPETYIIVRVWE